jgi:hypothetical protein
MAEQLRKLLVRGSFRLFRIMLNDGQQFHVWDREYVMLSPGGDTIVVCSREGTSDLLAIRMIESCRLDPIDPYLSR